MVQVEWPKDQDAEAHSLTCRSLSYVAVVSRPLTYLRAKGARTHAWDEPHHLPAPKQGCIDKAQPMAVAGSTHKQAAMRWAILTCHGPALFVRTAAAQVVRSSSTNGSEHV